MTNGFGSHLYSSPKITPFVPPEKQDGDKPSEGEAESV